MAGNDGGDAFSRPMSQVTIHPDSPTQIEYGAPGMSLRDWFAGHALPLVKGRQQFGHVLDAELARQAYGIADAMLAERIREPDVDRDAGA